MAVGVERHPRGIMRFKLFIFLLALTRFSAQVRVNTTEQRRRQSGQFVRRPAKCPPRYAFTPASSGRDVEFFRLTVAVRLLLTYPAEASGRRLIVGIKSEESG
jgi:hypothetical protein